MARQGNSRQAGHEAKMSHYLITTVRELERARLARDYAAERLDRVQWWRVIRVSQGIYDLIQAEKRVWELERRINHYL